MSGARSFSARFAYPARQQILVCRGRPNANRSVETARVSSPARQRASAWPLPRAGSSAGFSDGSSLIRVRCVRHGLMDRLSRVRRSDSAEHPGHHACDRETRHWRPARLLIEACPRESKKPSQRAAIPAAAIGHYRARNKMRNRIETAQCHEGSRLLSTGDAGSAAERTGNEDAGRPLEAQIKYQLGHNACCRVWGDYRLESSAWARSRACLRASWRPTRQPAAAPSTP